MDLGASWALFGRGLGRSGASFGHFRPHFGRFLDVPNHIFLKHWSKMSSQRPFGWILDSFGKVLGRFGEGWGRNLEGLRGLLNRSWADFGHAWHDLALLQQSL